MIRIVLVALVAAPILASTAGAQGRMAEHLERALALDATSRGIEAEREVAQSRSALANSLAPGSMVATGSFRVDTRGLQTARETDLELGMPLWLPGQRNAVARTVRQNVAASEQRLWQRRLEVSGLLREAWWDAALQRAETRLQRERVATARDMLRDVNLRYAQGEVPQPDQLLAENELVAAQLALAQAEAAELAAITAYRGLTGGAEPGTSVERPAPRGDHPAIRAAAARVAAAEAEVALVATTPIDNPEIGGFVNSQFGDVTEQGVSIGLRLRVPLPSQARNAPRRATAQAALTAANAEYAQTQRVVDVAIQRAQDALRASQSVRRLAQQRLTIADQQLTIANRGYRAGETTLFDLVRVRQIQIEAANAAAEADVAAGLARARLNQAMGAEPQG